MNPDMQSAALALVRANQMIQAIKVVREQTGWTLAQAKAYCEQLQSGNVPAVASTGQSLADRVRMYVNANDQDSAVRMLMYETGMTYDESMRFITALYH